MRGKWTLDERAKQRLGHVAVGAVLLATVVLWGCDVPGYEKKTASERTESQVELTPTSYVTPPPATTIPEPEELARPERPVTYEEAADAFRDARYAEATKLFESYVERKPENPWGHYMLGLSAWKARDYERAERAFDTALERDPKHLKSLVNLSRVLLETERPDIALLELESALKLDSTSAEVWRLIGVAHSDLHRTDQAIDAYRHAIRLDDRDHWSMNNLGLQYIRLSRFTDALPPLARAVALAPTIAVFQNNLGIALERSGYIGSAADAYRAAVAADETHEKARANLARVETRGIDLDIEADLESFAQLFLEEIRRWQALAVALPDPEDLLPEWLEYPRN